VRVILDPNVLIAAVLSPKGSQAKVLRAWLEGRFELIASPLLIAELERALQYPKLQERIPESAADRLVAWIERQAAFLPDPPESPPARSEDPGDDYLLALAARSRAVLVSGDRHLLALASAIPIMTPRVLLNFLARPFR
jgi:uncharacterized protein